MIAYNKESYNCAHHAIAVINSAVGSNIHFSDGDEWQVEFLRKLKKEFTRIKKPVDNCLVVMNDLTGGFHLGVYNNFQVEHNYNPMTGAGSVVKSDLGTIRTHYKRIRFYDYNHKIHK